MSCRRGLFRDEHSASPLHSRDGRGKANAGLRALYRNWAAVHLFGDWLAAVSFWRPAYEWRSTRQHWGLGARLNEIVMSPLAAKLIYGHIVVAPNLGTAANDTDGKRW
jgi:hypothetical protein